MDKIFTYVNLSQKDLVYHTLYHNTTRGMFYGTFSTYFVIKYFVQFISYITTTISQI